MWRTEQPSKLTEVKAKSVTWNNKTKTKTNIEKEKKKKYTPHASEQRRRQKNFMYTTIIKEMRECKVKFSAVA